MLHKTIIVGALVGVISCLAQQAIAQEFPAGSWGRLADLRTGSSTSRPGARWEGNSTPGQAEETDKLYNELMSNSFSDTHHTGTARMR